jgi:hypothetical protein
MEPQAYPPVTQGELVVQHQLSYNHGMIERTRFASWRVALLSLLTMLGRRAALSAVLRALSTSP